MTKTFLGRVHGQTIQFEEELGIADGAEVEVVVNETKPPQKNWGEGIQRSAGAAAGIPDFDRVFSQIEKERKAARFREANE